MGGRIEDQWSIWGEKLRPMNLVQYICLLPWGQPIRWRISACTSSHLNLVVRQRVSLKAAIGEPHVVIAGTSFAYCLLDNLCQVGYEKHLGFGGVAWYVLNNLDTQLQW